MANSPQLQFTFKPSFARAVAQEIPSSSSADLVLRRWVHGMGAWAIIEMSKAISDFGQRTPGGGKWPALSPRYSKLKAALGGPMTMGIGISRGTHKKGKLAMSLTANTAIQEDLIRLRIEAGSNVYYAGWFNSGTKKMPARPFLPTQKYADAYSDRLFWECYDFYTRIQAVPV